MAVVVCNANMLLNSWYRLDIQGNIYINLFEIQIICNLMEGLS